MRRIISKYYELYANQLDNLDEMDKFLETYNLSKLNQKESENVNRQIIPNEIEAVIQKLLTKVLDQMASQVNFTKHSYPSQTTPKNLRRGKTPKFFFMRPALS